MRTLLKSLIRRCLGIGNVGMIRNFADRKENQDQSRIHSKTMLLRKKKKVMSIIIPIFYRKQEGRLRMVGGKTSNHRNCSKTILAGKVKGLNMGNCSMVFILLLRIEAVLIGIEEGRKSSRHRGEFCCT